MTRRFSVCSLAVLTPVAVAAVGCLSLHGVTGRLTNPDAMVAVTSRNLPPGTSVSDVIVFMKSEGITCSVPFG